MSNSTDTVKGSLPNASGMESCLTPLSSAISEHSLVKGTPQAIRAWLMSLPEDSPANRSQLPASEQGPMIPVICGPQHGIASASLDPVTASLKTFQACLIADISEPSSMTWPKAGIVCGGVFYPQPKWERRISAIDSGYTHLWPTPNTMDSLPPRDNTKLREWNLSRDGRKNRQVLSNLREAIHDQKYQEWFPTPTTRDWRSGKASQATMEKNSRPLNEVVMWRTPSASIVEPKKSVVKLTGRTPQDPQVGLADQVGGKLNPMWVEWLMGFPLGWTDLRPLEMGKFQQWLEQHGIY
jgi:hypothetical protein